MTWHSCRAVLPNRVVGPYIIFYFKLIQVLKLSYRTLTEPWVLSKFYQLLEKKNVIIQSTSLRFGRVHSHIGLRPRGASVGSQQVLALFPRLIEVRVVKCTPGWAQRSAKLTYLT